MTTFSCALLAYDHDTLLIYIGREGGREREKERKGEGEKENTAHGCYPPHAVLTRPVATLIL
jgi:hypothetical protein